MESGYDGKEKVTDNSNVKNPTDSSTDPDERRASNASTSSSSSMRSSEFEDPGPLDVDVTRTAAKDNEVIDRGLGQQQQSSVESPDDKSSNKESPLQSPSLQTMERRRTEEEGEEEEEEQEVEGSSYRIPSYVFARNKSSKPIDWSCNSSDSLFSIHMGMSFTKEQINYLLQSGELNGAEMTRLATNLRKSETLHIEENQIRNPDGEPIESLPVESEVQPTSSIDTTTSPTTPSSDKEKEPSTSSSSDLPKKEEKDSKRGKPSVGEQVSPLSGRHSDVSGQSFAFPVLATDMERGSSVKTASVPQPEQEEQKPTEEADPQEPETQAQKPARTSWFSSCFSCCSCRS